MSASELCSVESAIAKKREIVWTECCFSVISSALLFYLTFIWLLLWYILCVSMEMNRWVIIAKRYYHIVDNYDLISNEARCVAQVTWVKSQSCHCSWIVHQSLFSTRPTVCETAFVFVRHCPLDQSFGKTIPIQYVFIKNILELNPSWLVLVFRWQDLDLNQQWCGTFRSCFGINSACMRTVVFLTDKPSSNMN